MRRREFNGVPTVSPVGLGLGFSEKRCPPRPFNLAIRGNHFREFPGTRRPPPTPVLSMKSKRGVRFQSKRGLAVKIGIFGFIGDTRGWTLKMRRRALSDTPVTLIGDASSRSTLSTVSRSNRRAVQSLLVDPCCYALLSCPTRLCTTSLSFPPAQTGASRPRAAAAEGGFVLAPGAGARGVWWRKGNLAACRRQGCE